MGGEQTKDKIFPSFLTFCYAVVGVTLVLLMMILFYTVFKTPDSGSSSPSSPANDSGPVQRPAVLVDLEAVPSGDKTETLGARDYLDGIVKQNRPAVVAGLNALCSEFHFYSFDFSMPDIILIIGVRDIDQIGVVLSDGNYKVIETRHATSFHSAYFTACGLLREHASGALKP